MAPNEALGFLLFAGILGLCGQGARTVVGIITLATYANSPAATENDVFNAARLVVSLIIGFIAGVFAGIAYYATKNGDVGSMSLEQFLGFAGAGYVGTDTIEAFTQKFFDSGSNTGLKTPPGASGDVSINDLATSLDALASIQDKIPNLAKAPTLTTTQILDFLKSLYPPADPKKWKPSDPLPKPDSGADTPEGPLNAIGNFFRRTGLANWWLDYADEKMLRDSSYLTLAQSVGQVFTNHGGIYVA